METEPAERPLTQPLLQRCHTTVESTRDRVFLGLSMHATRAALNRRTLTRVVKVLDESQDLKGDQDRGWWVLHRESTFWEWWYPWMSLLINYSSITSMYYMAYEWPGDMLITLDRCVWVMFVIDIILEFITDYKDEEGTVVWQQSSIILKYLSGWFIFDLIAVIPLSEFGYLQEECYLRLIRLLKIKRGLELMNGNILGPAILLIARPKNAAESQNLTILVKYIISFMQILGSMFFTTYMLAAVFYWWSNFTLQWENANGDHFVSHFQMEDMTGAEKLLRSCYFLASTLSTVGYGDYYATNTPEKNLLIFVLLVGISQFSLIVANFNSLLAEIDKNSSIGEDMDELSTWLTMLENCSQRVSQEIKDKVLKHFQYYWENDRLHDLALCWWRDASLEALTTSQDAYLNDMPVECRKVILEFLFDDLGAKYPMFFGKQKEVIVALSLHFQPRFFAQGQTIIDKDDEVEEVIFVMKGEVSCGLVTSTGFKELIFYQNHGIIGDYEALHRKRSLASYRVASQHGLQAFMLPAKVTNLIIRSIAPKQFVRIAISTEAKATYVTNTLKKYTNPESPGQGDFFSQLRKRLSNRTKDTNDGSSLPKDLFKSPPSVTKEVTRKDLIELILKKERDLADYRAKKNVLLLSILKRLSR